MTNTEAKGAGCLIFDNGAIELGKNLPWGVPDVELIAGTSNNPSLLRWPCAMLERLVSGEPALLPENVFPGDAAGLLARPFEGTARSFSAKLQQQCLAEFVTLVTGTDEQVLAFSREWGVIDDAPGVIDDKRQVHLLRTSDNAAVKTLPVERWRRIARECTAALAVADALASGRVPKPDDLRLFGTSFLLAKTPTGAIVELEEATPDQLLIAAANRLSAYVDELFDGFVRISFARPPSGECTVSVRPVGLMGGLTLALAARIAGSALPINLRTCRACGHVFAAAHGNQKYCGCKSVSVRGAERKAKSRGQANTGTSSL